MPTTIYQIISRVDAKQLGYKHYFTGIPCKRAHVTQRRTSDGCCVECSKLKKQAPYSPERYKRVKSQHRLNQVAWEKRHPEKVKAVQERWAKNPKSKLCNKKWRKNNPDKQALYNKIRNTRFEQAVPIWYEEDLVKQIYKKRDELNELWGTNFEVDHIIPINPKDGLVSGLHCWHNLQLLDGSLNNSKHDRYQTDW